MALVPRHLAASVKEGEALIIIAAHPIDQSPFN